MSVTCGVLPSIRISSTQTSTRGKDLVPARQCKAAGVAGFRRESRIARPAGFELSEELRFSPRREFADYGCQ